MRLIIKVDQKMVKLQILRIKMKIHRGYLALPTRIPKSSFFCQGRPNFEGRTAGKFRENGQKRKSIVMQIRKWSIIIRNTGLYSLVPNSLHCFHFPTSYTKLFVKTEEVSFQAKFCPSFAAPLPKIRDVFQILLIDLLSCVIV